ncbi:M91 family zinc metallopeptidase [Gloeobacter kilaueensis]|uniref:RTX toxins-related Ca2+-binding protein n=1 Tax=Gloeobacter kilaueensis (strain ATCC BAA-2537 / CCAP 1431/1 / ULC 316 / JS1) TaxID=1183438 RepID=U5QGU7_GLOK1|nr:M91 family zinc metallopeptidase [Gloeobacter kilaueensis]AGY56824.1 RTX toxins-related Ca2+-binding protein [Gloeobacter kilaueensis JS1]
MDEEFPLDNEQDYGGEGGEEDDAYAETEQSDSGEEGTEGEPAGAESGDLPLGLLDTESTDYDPNLVYTAFDEQDPAAGGQDFDWQGQDGGNPFGDSFDQEMGGLNFGLEDAPFSTGDQDLNAEAPALDIDQPFSTGDQDLNGDAPALDMDLPTFVPDTSPDDATVASTPTAPLGAAPAGPSFSETRDAKGNITLAGGDRNDTFNVTSHCDHDGNIDGVTVRDGRGRGHDYLGADADHLTIDGGKGDDTIRVDASVHNAMHLVGGDGNDRISGGSGDDRIEGGAGNDDISGGAGKDFIDGGQGNDYLRGGAGKDRLIGGDGNDLISGGADRDYIDGGKGDDELYGNDGDDTIYGGQGKDLVSGDAGNDYLEGGKGDDTVSGGTGDDFVSGGRGNDAVLGGEGNDTLNGGEGKDRLVGSSGDDTLYADSSDRTDGGAGTNRTVAVEFDSTLGSNISFDTNADVDGNPDTPDARALSGDEQAAFRDRVEDDLDLMRSSVNGQQLLRDIDNTGQNVTFRQIDVDNGYADWAGRGVGNNPFLDASGNPAAGQDVTIGYNPNINVEIGGKEETPFEVLYHEMSHGWNITSGTLQSGTYTGADEPAGSANNDERQAVGLPNQGVPFDNDNNPATPASRDNPTYATERGISDELGRQQRPNYTGPLT